MKTKINHHLLGAVLSPLVTLGLARNSAAFARMLIIGLAALVAAPTEAASGSGAGGGTIYYVGPWPGVTDHGTAVMTTMNSDGSAKTALGLGMFGNPSWVRYNNHRYFISKYVIPGEYYPDGVTKRQEVFACRDDYDINLNNNATTRVQLTGDPTLQPDYSDWVPGGAQISFRGRRWASVAPGATVAEGGIYTASLAFDANGNIIGLGALPVAPTIPFPLVEVTPGDPWPALSPYFCWSPTGSMLVYADVTRYELWVADLFNTHPRIFAGPGMADQPQWSPDGSLIVFRNGYGIATITPNGTGFKVIIPNTSTWLYSGPHFSPTGSQIVYTGYQQTSGNFDVCRATSKGGSQVNLSNTSYPLSEYTTLGAGWR